MAQEGSEPVRTKWSYSRAECSASARRFGTIVIVRPADVTPRIRVESPGRLA